MGFTKSPYRGFSIHTYSHFSLFPTEMGDASCGPTQKGLYTAPKKFTHTFQAFSYGYWGMLDKAPLQRNSVKTLNRGEALYSPLGCMKQDLYTHMHMLVFSATDTIRCFAKPQGLQVAL